MNANAQVTCQRKTALVLSVENMSLDLFCFCVVFLCGVIISWLLEKKIPLLVFSLSLSLSLTLSISRIAKYIYANSVRT